MSKIIGDGVLCSQRYSAVPVKVMHLLKQVNSGEGGWTLPQLLEEQVIDKENNSISGQFPVWKNLARWSYLLQQGGRPTFEKLDDFQLIPALLSSAVVNLMNELGGSITGAKELLRAAKDARQIWGEQIKQLQPDYVVCGGTFWVLEDLGALPAEVKVCSSGMRYCQAPSGAVYLDFVHPANRVRHAMMYAWLRETVTML